MLSSLIILEIESSRNLGAKQQSFRELNNKCYKLYIKLDFLRFKIPPETGIAQINPLTIELRIGCISVFFSNTFFVSIKIGSCSVFHVKFRAINEELPLNGALRPSCLKFYLFSRLMLYFLNI